MLAYCRIEIKRQAFKGRTCLKIAVIVVTFNSMPFIERCLESVLCQKGLAFEIIVVDNGSGDGTSDFIKSKYPDVRLITNENNKGAAFARNQGIAVVDGDWVLTLDADAWLSSDCFVIFKDYLDRENSDRVGIVAPKINYSDGLRVYSRGNQLTFLRRFYEEKNVRKIFGACSAAAFYKKDMLEELKVQQDYFDERFFYMAEDVDLAWRCRKHGWGVKGLENCVAFHDGGGSGIPQKLKDFYSIRNRFIMMMKNDSVSYLFVMSLPLLMYDFFRFLKLVLKKSGAVYIKSVKSAFQVLMSR